MIWTFENFDSLYVAWMRMCIATHGSILQRTAAHCNTGVQVCGVDVHLFAGELYDWYGVATISRLLKIIGLYCRISSL